MNYAGKFYLSKVNLYYKCGSNSSYWKKYKGKLEKTKFAIHVVDKAWEYMWMNGFRIAVQKCMN